jgi:hypothetical protein
MLVESFSAGAVLDQVLFHEQRLSCVGLTDDPIMFSELISDGEAIDVRQSRSKRHIRRT